MVIGVVILLFGGCATMCASITSNVGSNSSDHKGSSGGSSSAGIGQEVRDGKFAFVVKSVDTRTTGTGLAKPRGEFIVVTMTVTNSGNEPQSFFAGNQKLIDTAGREYASDTMAALSMNEDSMAIDLNPGFTLNVKVPFDVPPGTQPSAVVLHDSAFSGGAKVSLG
ncbi:DUF4352 domain-containing protein [Mycolicibacterium sp. CH28]|uniref:DUF4352 domain-containing protein n=1 Tax=Mycolicibacterium sp. CH28 TaxID=2512237 RepID=UPI002107424D|nr:DUF4352 domain-containing protein [Mycolicibacterium sp. CH28]